MRCRAASRTDDGVHWSSMNTCWVLRCFGVSLRGLGETGTIGDTDGVVLAHQRTSLSRRQQSVTDRFWIKTFIQWFQLHVRARFPAAGTVEVAASLADTYGIIDCLSQLMCFADMLCVSGAKRVD